MFPGARCRSALVETCEVCVMFLSWLLVQTSHLLCPVGRAVLRAQREQWPERQGLRGSFGVPKGFRELCHGLHQSKRMNLFFLQQLKRPNVQIGQVAQMPAEAGLNAQLLPSPL